MEFKMLKVSDLQEFAVREIRQEIVDKLKERIDKDGYNNSRPLSVVKKDNVYIIADGNHRYNAIKDSDIDVPCVVYDDDIYTLATRMNQDEDTYAPMDLFDWLDVINSMKDAGYTLKKIGEMIGWSESNLKKYSMLSNNISSEILKQFKIIQRDVGTKKVPDGTFCENMFRDSGIYLLNQNYQQKFIDLYSKGKYRWDNIQAIKRMTSDLLLQQQGLEYIKDNLIEGVDSKQLLDNLDKGLYKDIEQIEKAVEKANEVFLDKQKIQVLNCDCFEMLKDLKDNSVDAIITDPPYFVTDNEWDFFKSEDEFLTFLGKLLAECKRVLKKESHLFMFMDSRWMAKLESIFINTKFNISSRIIWVRKNISMGRVVSDKFISQWEVCLHSGTKELNFPKNWGDERGDVQEYAVPQSNFNDKKLHPTQKPLEFIKRIVDLSSGIGELVVDPFCGSGTTAKACEELNRKCITCDTNLEYVKIAKNRIFGD